LRARLAWGVAALAFATLTCTAGVWQLSRAHRKLAFEAQVAERGAMPPLPAGQLARDAAAGELQAQRHIVLTGEWDAPHTIYLMNRSMDERSGFYVTTPLRLPDGTAVLVQRGWIARDDADPTKAPPVATPPGPVTVRGHVAPWPSHWIELGHLSKGAVRQNLELAPFSAESGLALRPVTVAEDAQAGNASDGLRRDWPAPTAGVSIATHYGYAFQWFAMAATVLVLYVFFQFIRPRRHASLPGDGDLPPGGDAGHDSSR
jgi:surfeit locus 1 family protein